MIYPRAIIPTILIPFTLVSVILSTIASFIAALFGLQLSTEGPRRLLEALLRPRVLVAGLLLNAAIYGTTKAWSAWTTLPRFEMTIARENAKREKNSDRVYPNSAESEVLRPAAESGASYGIETIWKNKLSGGSFAGAARSGRSLFVGTDDGLIEEIDATRGETLRSFYVGTSVSSAPLVRDGFLFAGEGSHETHHARVYKFDLKTGRFAGAYATKGHTEGRLVGASWNGRSLIFAPAGADGMHAIDAKTMKVAWHRTEGHSDASAAFDQGVVYWGTGREKSSEMSSRPWAVAADADDGAIRWKHELPSSSWMSPVIVGDDVCFPVGEIYVKSEIGGIYCFRKSDGSPSTTFNSGAGVVAPPVVSGTDLFVTDFQGRICRLSMGERKMLWCRETDGEEYSLAEVSFDRDRGILLYPSRKGGLFVLSAEDGRVLANWKPTDSDWESTYAPARAGGEGWIIADMKGNVRAIRVRSSPK